MLNIGEYQTLKIDRMTPYGAYLDDGDKGVLLPGKYVTEEMRIGDDLRVFIYMDSEDRPVATTEIPFGVVGDFVCLTVTDTAHFGVFVDWGLSKDLLIPHIYLHKRLRRGERVVIKIVLDEETNRPIGMAKLKKLFNTNTSRLKKGEKVKLLVYGATDLGYVVVVNSEYNGLLYKNEVFQKMDIGTKSEGIIKNVREDGKLDLSLETGGYNTLLSKRDVILEKLREEGGVLSYNDKSSPDEIKAAFSMSKNSFKRTIGILYREKKINISDDGISSIKSN